VAQEIGETEPRFDVSCDRFAVDDKFYSLQVHLFFQTKAIL
jgi:hypothetical protein